MERIRRVQKIPEIFIEKEKTTRKKTIVENDVSIKEMFETYKMEMLTKNLMPKT